MTLEDVLDNTTLRLKIKSPADTIIGRWKLFVNTFLKKEKDMSDEEKEGIRRYAYPQPVYILFNPWCKGKNRPQTTGAIFLHMGQIT